MNQEEQTQFECMSSAIVALAQAPGPQDVFRICKHFLRDFTHGAEHTSHDHGVLGIYQIKSPGLSETRRIAVTNWSGEYLSLRRALDDYTHDPSITLCAQTTSPFTWTKAFLHSDRRAQEVADRCAEHTGQRHGLTFPIADIKMLKGSGSIGFDLAPTHFSPTQIGMMHHVLIAAYARLYKLMGPFPEDEEDDYSPRQREVVRLLALGRSVKEAAILMQCTEDTAKYHIAQAKAKVGAATAAELIAKSMNKNVVLV